MRLAIATPKFDRYSESFIHQQIKMLPGDKLILHGSKFPVFYGAKTPIRAVPHSIPERLIVFWKHRILRRSLRSLDEKALEALLYQQNVDVLLAHYGTTGAELMNVCKRAGIPLIVHFHGCDAHMKEIIKTYNESYVQLGKKACSIIVVSEKMKYSLIDIGIPPKKIRLIPCGVDMNRFIATDAGQNPPIFISVGRFVSKKAPYLVVLAFHKVVRELPEARLVMVGDGFHFETAYNIVKALNLQNTVKFTGALSQLEVALEMRKARVFVQHSIEPKYGEHAGDSEGTPVAILEAGASGLPVVATRHAGIEQAVLHKNTGYLVEERDIDGMSHYMMILAKKPELASQMGHAARIHIKKYYSMNDQIRRLTEVIEAARG